MDTCYSLNNEEFDHTEFGDLLDRLDSDGCLAAGVRYYEADCRRLTPKDAISVDSLLEDMDQRICDLIGECFDNDFSDVTADAKKELAGIIAHWASKHVSLSRYFLITGRSREKTITEQDVAEHLA